MIRSKSGLTIFSALCLFTVFFGYYYILSENLRPLGGPDELAHYHAAKFVYENKRLAVYPNDEEKLHYAPSGTTRAFRPPLPYIVSAVVAGVLESTGLEPSFKFRKGSVLMAALTLVLIFLALKTYSGYLSLGIAVATLLGLMPQFSFLASYANSDMAAIMSCSLITLAVIRLLRLKTNTGNLVFLGIACGVLVLTKFTAWVFALPVFLFGLYLVVRSDYNTFKAAGILICTTMATGGWRFASNVVNHGPENIFNWYVDKAIRLAHVRETYEPRFGYYAWDKGVMDLLSNFHGFMSKTFYSTVGHLDLLALVLGDLQYFSYAFVFVVAVVYLAIRTLKLFRTTTASRLRLDIGFELVLMASLTGLFAMYMHFNLVYDIQTQGKYLLPAIIVPMLFFSSALCVVFGDANFAESDRKKDAGYSVGKLMIPVVALILVSLALFVHVHGFVNYVIPYYDKTVFFERRDEAFIQFKDVGVVHSVNDVSDFVEDANGYRYTAVGRDPWVLFQLNKNKRIPKDLILRIKFEMAQPGELEIYWDDGQGMRQENRASHEYFAGESTVYIRIQSPALFFVRFDIGNAGESIEVMETAYTRTRYRSRPVAWLYRHLYQGED